MNNSRLSKAAVSRLEDDYGYARGELWKAIKTGEAELGGEFVKLDDDGFFLFDIDGETKRYNLVNGRWYDEG